MRIYGFGKSDFGGKNLGGEGKLSKIYENASSKWHEMCGLFQTRSQSPGSKYENGGKNLSSSTSSQLRTTSSPDFVPTVHLLTLKSLRKRQ